MVPYPGAGGDLVAFLGPSLWVFGNCEQGGTTVGIQPTDQDEGLFILPHFVPPLPLFCLSLGFHFSCCRRCFSFCALFRQRLLVANVVVSRTDYHAVAAYPRH